MTRDRNSFPAHTEHGEARGSSGGGLDPAIRRWAEHTMANFFERAPSFRDIWDIGAEKISSFAALLAQYPLAAEKLPFLHEAQVRLRDEKAWGLDGCPVGENMRLVVVPWRALLDFVTDNGFLVAEYKAPDVDVYGDEQFRFDAETKFSVVIHPEIGQIDARIYVDPDDYTNRLTAFEYLESWIKRDGPVGFMLVQTMGRPGFPDQQLESPIETAQNTVRNGVDVGGLGVFEGLMAALQADLSQPEDLPQAATLLPMTRVTNMHGDPADLEAIATMEVRSHEGMAFEPQYDVDIDLTLPLSSQLGYDIATRERTAAVIRPAVL